MLRTTLASTAAAAVPLAGTRSKVHASTRPHIPSTGALSDQSAVRTLTLGDVRLTYIVDAAMELDPVGFFPAVPASYWRDHPEALTRSRRVAASAGGVLVERRGRRLLIDVGLGSNVLSPSFGVSRGGALLRTLRALQVSPNSIDTVAFTHLHTDHTGMGFVTGPDGELRKAFPRANYLVARAEWGPFWNGEIEAGAPSWDGFMVPMSRAMNQFENDDEVWPGVIALITPGHSPGHTTYVISAGHGKRILVIGDAFHTPAQMEHPEWPSGPDTDVDGVLTARKTLLTHLSAPRTYCFAFHFGDQAFGRFTPSRPGAHGWSPVPTAALLPPPLRFTQR
ncbi:MBL fold metallo-hydrolase [Streptomyces sp. SID14515]|nr:MBL fold metallo-hydrolase [Streptomyces sp. SID14515]